jgi:hypothetical protein
MSSPSLSFFLINETPNADHTPDSHAHESEPKIDAEEKKMLCKVNADGRTSRMFEAGKKALSGDSV